MLVRFLAIEISNFRSFESASLTLDKGGVTFVQGKIEGGSETLESNGAGKSSIFSAISYALFGKFPHVSGAKVSGDKVVRRGSSGGCFVSVKLRVENRSLEVTRFRLHSLHGDKLVVRVDDIEETQASNQKTQQVIETILGISFELFVNLIFVTEATIKDSFAFETDANRKKMLVSALPQFQRFGKSRMKVKDSLTLFTSFASKLRHEQAVYEKAFQDVREEAVPNTSQINSRMQQLQSEINELESTIKLNEAKIVDSDFHLSADNSSALASELSDAQLEIDGKQEELNSQRLQQGTAQNGLKKWKDLGSLCPTCGQTISHSEQLQHLQEFKNQLQELNLHMEGLQLQLNVLKEKKKTAMELQSELNLIRGELKSQRNVSDIVISSSKSTIEAKTSEINQLKIILQNLHEVKKLKDERQSTISNRIEEIGTTLSVVKNFESSLSVWLDGFGPKGVVSLALNNIVDNLTHKTETWLQRLWHEGATLSFEFAGEDLSKIESKLYVNQKIVDLESLSSGETRRVCLALCFGLRESLQELTGWKSNLLILDEVFDGLDGVGRTKVLSELKQLPDSSVFVISQFPQLSEDIDRVIQVRFSKNVSTLNTVMEK